MIFYFDLRVALFVLFNVLGIDLFVEKNLRIVEDHVGIFVSLLDRIVADPGCLAVIDKHYRRKDCFLVLNRRHNGLIVLPDSDAGIRSTEIDRQPVASSLGFALLLSTSMEKAIPMITFRLRSFLLFRRRMLSCGLLISCLTAFTKHALFCRNFLR